MNLAPNGKASNLNPEQYSLVRTPAFKAWFGDWENDAENSSKVVDENGEPMVVYHGTSKDFYIFGEGKNKDILEEYQEQYNFKKKVNYFHKNKEYAETFGSKYGGYEKPFFLNIKKIEVVEENEIEDIGYWKNIYDYYVILRNLDGINSKSGQYATLLNPHQIKLADGINTTFNSNNPDIRFELGGIIEKYKDYDIEIKYEYEYIVTALKDGKRVGLLTFLKNPYLSKNGNLFLMIDSINVNEKERGFGLATKMYEFSLKHLPKKYKGISSYLKNRVNKKQIPKIYSKFNNRVENWGGAEYHLIEKNNPDIRYADGGSIPDLLSSQEVEYKLGRKLDWWNDDIVYLSGIKYKKVYLRLEYKKVIE
jgi:hypothetical protein